MNSGPVMTIPIDWWVHIGGFLKIQFEEQIEEKLRDAHEVSLELLMRPDPVVAHEIEAWILTYLKSNNSDRHRKQTFMTSVKTQKAWIEKVSSFQDFSWQSLPPSSNSSSEEPRYLVEDGLSLFGIDLGLSAADKRSIVPGFIDQMLDAGVDLYEPPWIFWSRFSAWRAHFERKNRVIRTDVEKNRDADAAFRLDSHLTFLRCALSPQDEISEAQSLDLNEIMLNPTFEVVQNSRSKDFPIEAYSRSGWKLERSPLSMLEAMVIDDVRESFRVNQVELSKRVAAENGIQPEFVQKTVDRLKSQGFLLFNAERLSN